LQNLTPYLQKYHGTGQVSALFIDSEKNSDSVQMGDYVISIQRTDFSGALGLFGVPSEDKKEKEKSAAGLLVFQLTGHEFLLAGGVGGILINISKGERSKFENVEYASVDEITFENGQIKSHRLNGDETAFGGAVLKPGEVKIFQMKMYGY
jgi:hypothetical protein